jgi:hypothetical protein
MSVVWPSLADCLIFVNLSRSLFLLFEHVCCEF